MENLEVLEDYGAQSVIVPDDMMAWMRSDHAGETGAVWIYIGARCAFWSPRIRRLSLEHGQTERRHLLVMEHLVPPTERSRLIPLWRLMGFTLGFLAALFGYRNFCHTIHAVETFVEQHYTAQINKLEQTQSHPALLAILQRCCSEEVHHQRDAHARTGHARPGRIARGWAKLVGAGSELAVKAAMKV